MTTTSGGRCRQPLARAWGRVTLLALAIALATAAADSGSRAGPADAPPSAPFAAVVPGSYAPPVDSPVVDPFRMPDGPYGAGNRGLEYATRPGSVVGAIGAGVVAFAGQVAGRLVVSIVHADGRRSSLTGLAVVTVARGQLVSRGAPVGLAGPSLHLGVREGERYIDPASLFVGDRRAARLVPALFVA